MKTPRLLYAPVAISVLLLAVPLTVWIANAAPSLPPPAPAVGRYQLLSGLAETEGAPATHYILRIDTTTGVTCRLITATSKMADGTPCEVLGWTELSEDVAHDLDVLQKSHLKPTPKP